MCGISALAMKTNAPNCLRDEAFDYPDPEGAKVLGSSTKVAPEKAVVANRLRSARVGLQWHCFRL